MPLLQVCFGVITLWTQHKFPDESIQHVLQLVRLMGAVDNVTVVLGIKLGLSAQLAPKKTWWDTLVACSKPWRHQPC